MVFQDEEIVSQNKKLHKLVQKWYRVVEQNASQRKDMEKGSKPKEDEAGENLDILANATYLD